MVRFDFENFVSTFVTFLRDAAKSIIREYNLEDEWDLFMHTLIDNKSNITKTLKQMNMLGAYTRSEMSMILLAAQFQSEADMLQKSVDKIKQSRERETGMGIYVSSSGQIYDLNDISIADIVRKEQEEFKGRIKQ
jgi:hypothetical protein